MTQLLLENAFINELKNQIQFANEKIFAFIYYARILQTRKNDDTEKILKLLVDAKNRGVEVKLLINNPKQKNR
jgi:phosphatidylserine/phosphatidylglycerophosphate/cardiolipin synthase-like enzyme